MNGQKNKKVKKGFLIGGIAILAVALMAGPLVLGMASSGQENYLSVEATKMDLQTYYQFSGSVTSENMQTVFAEKMTQIIEIHVNEGDEVSEGTLLFTTSDGTKITSDINGTINQIAVEKDQQVAAGGQLAEIIDLTNLEVVVNVDEYDLNAVAIDQKIAVTIGAIDKTIEGTISEVSRTATNQNGVAYFQATVKLSPDEAIKVGMSAEAKIIKAEAQAAITIPVKALSFNDENESFVYIADETGEMSELIVETGITDGKNVEIKTKITEGDTIYYEDPTAAPAGPSFLPPMPGM